MKTPKPAKIPLDSPVFEQFPQFKKAVGDWKPRTRHDTCLLCETNESGKKESHILPDFFTKSIFRDPAKRRFVITNGLAKLGTKSSTPKEDYILCHSCEEKLGALERLISLVLPKGLDEVRASGEFSPQVREHHIESIGIHPALFHLFVYSLLWRAHITQQGEFSHLTLSAIHAEELRSTLNTCLNTKEKPMIEAMIELFPTRLPLYYQVLLAHQKPINMAHTLIGIGWHYDSDYGYRLYTSDFLFKFSASDEDKEMKLRGAAQLGSIIAISAHDWEGIVAGMINDIARINKEVLGFDENSHLRPRQHPRQGPDHREPTA